jgi:hypothetical protein
MRRAQRLHPSEVRQPVADRLKNNEARILLGFRASREIELEGQRLCASLARLHPIVLTKRPIGALEVERIRLTDRGHDHRTGRTHERTLARKGQRAIGDVA